jgi:hypothetical protein
MSSTLFQSAIAAELAALKNENDQLKKDLLFVTKQRDNIKHKWEQLDVLYKITKERLKQAGVV